MSTPTTFEAHGHTWTQHNAGDGYPCDGDKKVLVCFKDGTDSGTSSMAAEWWEWDNPAEGEEIIGWRFPVATPPQEKDELKIPDNLAEKLKAHVGAPSELTRLREIVDACMKAMPCGNIATHTPENLAGRIEDLAQSLAAESLENESMRTAIQSAITSFEYIQNHERDFTSPELFYWNALNQSRAALATLSPFTESK